MTAPTRVRSTPLTRLLMGLLRRRPRSGYELLKTITDLPLIRIGHSPGSIYPALARLERAGLVRSHTRTRGARASRVYELTPTGVEALRGWLTEPLSRDEIAAHPDLLVIRFWFLPLVVGPSELAPLLARYQADVEALREEAVAYVDEHGEGLSAGARLAFDLSLSLIRAQEAWARRTRQAIEGPAVE